MKSFSYQSEVPDSRRYYELWTAIEKLKRYFYKYNGVNCEEAMLETLQHAVKHYDPNKGDIEPYLKNLARNASKKQSNVEIPCDFLEETVSEEYFGTCIGDPTGVVREIIAEIDYEIDKRDEIARLALSHMSFFSLFCESVINRDSTTRYFPESFVSEILKISGQTKKFNETLLNIYAEHRNGLAYFVGADVNNEGNWREADFEHIRKSSSKRVSLCNNAGDTSALDSEGSLYFRGNLEGKAVVAVDYYELFNSLCDLVDCSTEGITALRYDIGDHFIVRSLGGSLSIVNPNLLNIYSLFRSEIITNILYDLNARYLGCGDKFIYVMANKKEGAHIIPKKLIKNIEIELNAIDITEELIKLK